MWNFKSRQMPFKATPLLSLSPPAGGETVKDEIGNPFLDTPLREV